MISPFPFLKQRPKVHKPCDEGSQEIKNSFKKIYSYDDPEEINKSRK